MHRRLRDNTQLHQSQAGRAFACTWLEAVLYKQHQALKPPIDSDMHSV